MKANRSAATMLTAVLCLTAAACQGDSPKPPPVTSTPITSPTPTPTSTAAALPDFTKWQDKPADIPVPPMPAAAKKHTRAGSVAFAKYYIDILNYVILAADSSPAHSLRASSCSLCRQLEDRFTTIVGQGNGYLGDPRYRHRFFASSSGYSTAVAGVNGHLERSKWKSRDPSSTKANSEPAERVGIVVRLEPTDGGWRVVSFSAENL